MKKIHRVPIIPICDICAGVGDCPDPKHPVREFNKKHDAIWQREKDWEKYISLPGIRVE